MTYRRLPMPNSLARTATLVVVVSVFSGATSPVANAADDNDVSAAIELLQSDLFAVRQQATLKLVAAGRGAITPLAAAAERSVPEVSFRAISILNRLAMVSDEPVAGEARQALEQLAASDNARASAFARAMLRARRERIKTELRLKGATFLESDGRVLEIYFHGTNVKDRDLRWLAEFPDVRHLSLRSTFVGDEALQHVSRLEHLERLDLFETNVTDEGLVHIKNLKKLVEVPAGKTRITDAGLVHFKDMPQLMYLGLRGNRITDAGLVHLEDLTNLTGLYLGETLVTDAGLVHLRKMTNMEYLRLHTLQVSDAAVPHLTHMRYLQQIDLFSTRFTDAGIAALQRALPNCRINLNGSGR